MAKRTDIKKILIIGSGPIVIGQACEFDYSGAQACKSLREEGYGVVLVNSNPATIMTDPEFADSTYIEPVTAKSVEKIIARERPDALLPTLGGQTGLNTAIELYETGVLEKYNVEMIGAGYDVIKKAEDRKLFKKAMENIGLDLPVSHYVHSVDDAMDVAASIGYPCIVRASFTLGGTGGGIAWDRNDLQRIVSYGLDQSMIGEVLIEESILGWKEYELEVMRDRKDNCVIICSIENLDPMGIHTGDSITVAPAQTLTDDQYQFMRDASLAVMREIGVETGGSNVQFAVNPANGRMVVIEMNPRVSRSSALASKATGFPIAKIAAKLAVGYTLDEIRNDITRKTVASFEPTLDYCVVKIPRFTFEKFPEAEPVLGVSMKSVGETMAIGRNFREAFQKGLRGLETGHRGFDNRNSARFASMSPDEFDRGLSVPGPDRMYCIKYAMRNGMSVERIHELTRIDPWFLDNMLNLVEIEGEIRESAMDPSLMLKAKQNGFSDAQIAELKGMDELSVRTMRKGMMIRPVYKAVDTCAAEFEAYTPYYYSTYELENEAIPSDRRKIIILGGGPNRIGQGIEFDYCCCHASFALKEAGFETIMVNSNPETVSTDYDTSDRLYFEPLTYEDVMNIVENEKPTGVIVQFGGQSPLSLAESLGRAGVPIIGTSVESIQIAEDRDKFSNILRGIGLRQTENGSALTIEEARHIAREIGYPVLVRPSFVLGGRAMKIVYDENRLEEFIGEAFEASDSHPVLIDRFLEDAIEVDVDALSDGRDIVIGGIMEHIEQAGIHSGDSACVLPPYTLAERLVDNIRDATRRLASALQVRGLMNIQFAIKGSELYVLEVNPRASRTVPFVSKATGMPLAKIASLVMAGATLEELGVKDNVTLNHVAVKESVLPFSRFSGVDIVLGPEMKSTGEVMGIDGDFGTAFYKAQEGSGSPLPVSGRIFISIADAYKRDIAFIARRLSDMGYEILATRGTSRVLTSNRIPVQTVNKVGEGTPDIVDLIKEGNISLIINIPEGEKSLDDARPIRSASVVHRVPCITTLPGLQAAVHGIDVIRESDYGVRSIQEWLAERERFIVPRMVK